MSELSLNPDSSRASTQPDAHDPSLDILSELWLTVIHLCQSSPAAPIEKHLINGTGLSGIPRGPRAFALYCDISVHHTLASYDFQTEGWQEFYDQLGSWMIVMSEARTVAPHYPMEVFSLPIRLHDA